MTEQARTYFALGLAFLSWCLLAAGWYWSLEPGWKIIRILGFALGGMASVPTLVLCIYYMHYRGIKNKGLKVATAVAGVYAVPFVIFFGGVLTEHPLAARWVAYAF
jgi:hypothetical protein